MSEPFGRFDLKIVKGDTFPLKVTWKDSAGAAVNLTGYTAKAQGRATYATATPAWTAATTPGAGQGTITLGGALGTIEIELPAAVTAALTGSGVWDLQMTDGAAKIRTLLSGYYTILGEVTQ